MRVLGVLLIAVVAAAAANAATPRRTLTLSPPRQFVTVPVQIRGTHWRRCAARIHVSVRMPSGRTAAIGRPKLQGNGGFRTSWRPPRPLAGHTVRIRASETCGKAEVSTSAPLQVLPTP